LRTGFDSSVPYGFKNKSVGAIIIVETPFIIQQKIGHILATFVVRLYCTPRNFAGLFSDDTYIFRSLDLLQRSNFWSYNLLLKRQRGIKWGGTFKSFGWMLYRY